MRDMKNPVRIAAWAISLVVLKDIYPATDVLNWITMGCLALIPAAYVNSIVSYALAILGLDQGHGNSRSRFVKTVLLMGLGLVIFFWIRAVLYPSTSADQAALFLALVVPGVILLIITISELDSRRKL